MSHFTFKKLSLVTALFTTLFTYSCNTNNVSITFNITKSSGPIFHNVTLDATDEDMKNAGFEYGDLVEIKIEKNGEIKKKYNVAYVTNYNEAGSFNKCLCDFESKGEKLNISPGLDNKGFDDVCFEGGTCTITMLDKGGYKQTRNNAIVTTKLDYEECGRNNGRYANFRDIVQIGTISYFMDQKKLYRGSSPFNFKRNEDRYKVVDQMLSYYDINSEISVSFDDDEKLSEIMNSEELNGFITKNLYETRNYTHTYERKFFTKNLGNDFFDLKSGGIQICEIFDYIYKKIDAYNKDLMSETPIGIDAPIFFIHCDEGKDRTGFLIMLLESLCGCSYEDIIQDFMETFFNYYNISTKNNKEKYDVMAELTCYRNLYSFLMPVNDGETRIDKLANLDLYSFNAKDNVEKIIKEKGENYLNEAAVNYLKEILSTKYTDEEATKIINVIRSYFIYTPPDK